jgi:molybdate transport system substrate-binding protein
VTRDPGLHILAAGSLRPAFGRLAGEVRIDYANARDLAARIEAGAKVDVFASASPEHPLALREAGLVGEPRAFASNRLVVAVAGGSPAHDFGVLAAPGTRVVIEVAGIPLGDYTREMLGRLDAADADRALANVVAQEQTVDRVAARILAGEADAAVLYATDVAARPGDLRAIELPPGAGVTVTCVACVVAASPHRARADALINWLTGPSGQELMGRAGFGPAEKGIRSADT